MSRFVPDQVDDAVVPQSVTASGHIPNKPPMPWPDVMAMFKANCEPKPPPPIFLVIAQNTILKEDKATALRCWLAMDGTDGI